MEDEARVSPDRERPVGPKTQKGHGGLAWLSHNGRVPPGSWSQPLIKRGENPRVQKGLDRRLPPGTKDRRVRPLVPNGSVRCAGRQRTGNGRQLRRP